MTGGSPLHGEEPTVRPWTRAAVALGSNLGDRAAHLEAGVRAIRALPLVRVLSVSEWIETEPVGGPAGAMRYLNGALLLETGLSARRLLQELLAIEQARGRERKSRKAGERGEPRTLDLDLLLFGEERIDEPGLIVPHPRLEERAFVLLPLAQIAPALRLPSGSTPAERLSEISR